MGIGISNLIKEEKSTNKHITVYVSKSTSDLESRIENLLDKDVDIVNLDM